MNNMMTSVLPMRRLILSQHRPAVVHAIEALRPALVGRHAFGARRFSTSGGTTGHLRTAQGGGGRIMAAPGGAAASARARSRQRAIVRFLSQEPPRTATTASFGAGGASSTTASSAASSSPEFAAVAAASAFAAATFGTAAYATFHGDGCSDYSPTQAEGISSSSSRPAGVKHRPLLSPHVMRWEEELEHYWDDYIVRSIHPEEEEEEYHEDDDGEEHLAAYDEHDHKIVDSDQDQNTSQEDQAKTRAPPPRPTQAQEEYVAECERSVPSENRIFERHFWTTEHESANSNIELKEWYEYIESTLKSRAAIHTDDEEDDEEDDEGEGDDEDEQDLPPAPSVPDAVAAAARVRLHDEVTGHPAIAAYVRDHNGRLLGVEQFTDGVPGECERSMGRCPFRLTPGEGVGSVRVFVIYGEESSPSSSVSVSPGRNRKGSKKRGKGVRRLYYSPLIPIPSVPAKFDPDEGEGDENWVPCA